MVNTRATTYDADTATRRYMAPRQRVRNRFRNTTASHVRGTSERRPGDLKKESS